MEKKSRVLKGFLVWGLCLEWCIPHFVCLDQFKGHLGGRGRRGLWGGWSLGSLFLKRVPWFGVRGGWRFLKGSKSIQWCKTVRKGWFEITQRKENFVKIFYTFLKPEEEGDFLMEVVWNSRVPMKMAFFAWEAVWRSILTLDRLKRREWSLANRWSPQMEEETTNHTLLHCVKGLVEPAIFAFWSGMGITKEGLWGKTQREVWRQPHCAYFGPYGKMGIARLLKIRDSSIKPSKCCFRMLLYCSLRSPWMQAPFLF